MAHITIWNCLETAVSATGENMLLQKKMENTDSLEYISVLG